MIELHSMKGWFMLFVAILIALFLAPIWNKYVASTVPSLTVAGV